MRIALLYDADIGQVNKFPNGFGPRYESILMELAKNHELHVVRTGAQPTDSAGKLPQYLSGRHYLGCDPPHTRSERLAAMAEASTGRGRPSRITVALCELLQRLQIDAVFIGIYWHLPACRRVVDRYPTAVFLEEDLSRNADLLAVTRLGRMFAELERRAAFSVAQRANEIVVISATEREWVLRTCGREPIVVPHAVDVGYWSATRLRTDVVRPPRVLSVGEFGHERNASGLERIASQLDRQPGNEIVIDVVSRREPIASFDFRSHDCIRWIGSVEDVRPLYRSATAALVPSFEVSGSKTTILQAWAAGVPVVTTTSAASSVGARDGGELLAGATPEEVVRKLESVVNDAELAERISERGRHHLLQHHGPTAVAGALSHLVESLAQRAGQQSHTLPTTEKR